MRLKSFHGANLADAMNSVRVALGADAIIVATRNESDGTVRVTAAIDDAAAAAATVKPVAPSGSAAPASPKAKPEPIEPDSLAIVAAALVRHNLPSVLAEKLLATATQTASEDPLVALAAALDTHVAFQPLPEVSPGKPLLFVGPPGAGKTLCVAKSATRLTLARRPVAVISADTDRAGGVEQLEAFTRLLETELVATEDSHALREALALQSREATVLIDTAGRDILDPEAVAALRALQEASGALMVLVMPADMDALEALDRAKAFQALGPLVLMPTRLDLTRRLGGLVRLAVEARLPLAQAEASPKVTEPPALLNPVTLARRLLVDPSHAASKPAAPTQPRRAASSPPSS